MINSIKRTFSERKEIGKNFVFEFVFLRCELFSISINDVPEFTFNISFGQKPFPPVTPSSVVSWIQRWPYRRKRSCADEILKVNSGTLIIEI